MSRKKGLWRITKVVYIFICISPSILWLGFIINHTGKDIPFAVAVFWAVIFFFAVWTIHYAVSWIIKGFRDENEKETQEVKEQI